MTCPGCQSVQTVPVTTLPPALPGAGVAAAACNRQTYILVGILTALLAPGGFGIHNFVAGRNSTAITQCVLCGVGVLLAFCTLGLSFLLNFAVMIWAIVDVCTVTTDGQGRRMA